MHRPRTVALLGHYGRLNLGDEATIQAVIENVRARMPDARIVAFSMGPEETAARHGIEAWPVRRKAAHLDPVQPASVPGAHALIGRGPAAVGGLRERLKRVPGLPALVSASRTALHFLIRVLPGEVAFTYRSVRRLQEVDVLMIVGSGQLTDLWGGPWSHPFELFRWALLGRLARARPCLVSVGAGPIDRPLSKAFIRACLRLCKYRAVRDELARDLVHRIGFRGECHVYPDLAHSLGSLGRHAASRRAREAARRVGINVMPVFDGHVWPNGSEATAADYRATMAEFATHLMQTGHEVFFFGMHPKDAPVMHDVIDRMRRRGAPIREEAQLACNEESVGDVVDAVASADFVVATRFHAAVLPLAMGIPCIGVAYDPKTPALLAQMGQDRFSVDFDESSATLLKERFAELVANEDAVKTELRGRAKQQRDAMNEQYDRIARMVPLRVDPPMASAGARRKGAE